MRCWHASPCLRPASLTRARFPWPALGNLREEPSAGKPHARIRGGESRMAELPDHPRKQSRPSLGFQSISPGNYLEFATDGFLDRNDRSSLEDESRKHRTKLVNGHRIVALYQHMATPLADSYHEEFDREIRGRLPLTEYLQDSLLGILVLDGRTLRAFEPADHVLHWHPPNCVGPRNDCCLDGLTDCASAAGACRRRRQPTSIEHNRRRLRRLGPPPAA